MCAPNGEEGRLFCSHTERKDINWTVPHRAVYAGFGDPTYWKGPQTTRGVGPLSGYTQAGASVVAEWGKRGHTLIKAGFPQSSVDPMELPQHTPGPW
eukprot:COSAG02_NODE_1325_length_13237_cov_5.436901_13_plen_97_part_00